MDYVSILELTPEGVSDLGLEDEATASGIADTSLTATYGLYEDFDRLLFVDAGIRAKLPTASRRKGLGTGKFAADLQVDALKVFGPWTLMASASYGFRHHGRGQRNVPSFSAGIGRSLSEAASVGAIYEWRRAFDPRSRDGRDTIIYVAHRFNDRLSLTAYGVRSLTSTGVDIQAGLRFTTRWR